ncbi:FecR domain-containing protein [Massilia forsythiae]|uniref:FecR domain-containing protein n=1 Tax=Massilia forsythiae TaxID=2728020 RepID=A0A7Z2VWY5_9BURK|nr:FecR domain-containing protein [Massilia forsythiae]QJE00709.1 FecR domain-containing protein [Massilia forsythiae]
MLRHQIATIVIACAWACAAQGAYAADAGRIIFTSGKASIGDQPAVEGARVQEGQLLATGNDGYLYIKTVDNGLFILRPGSRARIDAYHVDNADPANTRVKFELLGGVARSKSGDAVKQARQNFRFNTPVAAIGVRGTDFTVFTDEHTSRVAVLTGGVVVSGFAGACSPAGSGPCDGAASRELSAAQRGQLLQVTRGQAAPQLLSGSALAPDLVSPPRTDEPVAKTDAAAGGSSTNAVTPNLEAKKVAALNSIAEQAPAAQPLQPVLPAPTTPAPVPVPVAVAPVQPDQPVQPDSGIVWGRWQQVDAYYPKFHLPTEMSKNELIALDGDYALLRTPGRDFVAPNNGAVGFTLREAEAVVYTDYGYGSFTVAPATVANGRLNVDFGSRGFTTSFDILSKGESFPFQASGTVDTDGRLNAGEQSSPKGYLNLQGLLSNDKGGSAAYIFNGRIDDMRRVNGATYWQKR